MTGATAAAGPAHRATVVLHFGGIFRGSEHAVVERALSRRPGVVGVEANPVAQTATLTFDPSRTSIEELTRWVEECGYHCAGRSVPGHICDPLADMEPLAPAHERPLLHRGHQLLGRRLVRLSRRRRHLAGPV